MLTQGLVDDTLDNLYQQRQLLTSLRKNLAKLGVYDGWHRQELERVNASIQSIENTVNALQWCKTRSH